MWRNTSLTRTMDSLARLVSGVVAVSGGVDSRLVASAAVRARMECVHVAGPHVAGAETREAVSWLEGIGASYSVLEVDPLVHPAVGMNRRDRCYHCKRAMFEAVAAHAPGRVLMDGSNASDFAAYRPGLRALAELGVRSPLAELGVDKAGVRALARHVGLDDPDQPSAPCLLTRLPYGAPVRARDLARVAGLEQRCREAGFREFRVRLVDGEPVLFAHERERGRGLAAPLAVRWVQELSGYWDRPESRG